MGGRRCGKAFFLHYPNERRRGAWGSPDAEARTYLGTVTDAGAHGGEGEEDSLGRHYRRRVCGLVGLRTGGVTRDVDENAIEAPLDLSDAFCFFSRPQIHAEKRGFRMVGKLV